MTMGIMPGPGLSYGGSSWTPAQLFSSGEAGAWWDPSDFSTMFQDSAGTTPVTAVGQSVGMIKDKSGNAQNWVQPTSAARPTIEQDGSGYYYLQFTATSSQFLAVPTPNALSTGTNSVMMVSGCKYDNTSASEDVYARSLNAAGGGRYWFGRTSAGNFAINWSYNSGGGVASGGGADTSTVVRVNSGAIDRVAGSAYTHLNGSLFGSAAPFTPDSATSWTPSYRALGGAYNDSTDSGEINFLTGRIYGMIVLLVPSISSTNLGLSETWMGTKCGIVI